MKLSADMGSRAESLPGAARSRLGRRAGFVVVKLGGSHAFGPYLRDWLSAIVAETGAIMVVPGGGPFADAVRAAQGEIGFDDRAAHAMALMAMTQFGCALQSLEPRLRLTRSRAAIRRALREGMVPVWAAEAMALAAGLPATWALTSDSLAAWLAGELRTANILLIKHGRIDAPKIDADQLAERGVVDPLFPHYFRQSGARAWLAAEDDSAKLALGLRRAIFPEIV